MSGTCGMQHPALSFWWIIPLPSHSVHIRTYLGVPFLPPIVTPLEVSLGSPSNFSNVGLCIPHSPQLTIPSSALQSGNTCRSSHSLLYP